MLDESYYTPIGMDAAIAEPPRLVDMAPGMGAYLEAQAGNVIRDSPTSSAFRALELAGAGDPANGHFDEWGNFQPGAPTRRTLSAEMAKARADEAGIKLDFGEGDTTEAAVTIMIDRAVRRQDRDAIIAARKPYLATQLVTALGVSLADR